jgi:hypothetical protein
MAFRRVQGWRAAHELGAEVPRAAICPHNRQAVAWRQHQRRLIRPPHTPAAEPYVL